MSLPNGATLSVGAYSRKKGVVFFLSQDILFYKTRPFSIGQTILAHARVGMQTKEWTP